LVVEQIPYKGYILLHDYNQVAAVVVDNLEPNILFVGRIADSDILAGNFVEHNLEVLEGKTGIGYSKYLALYLLVLPITVYPAGHSC